MLLIDEFDHLMLGRSSRDFDQKLYCLFDWPGQSYANLTIVLIANSFAVPNEMKPRCLSRFGGFARWWVLNVCIQVLGRFSFVHIRGRLWWIY